MADASRSSGVLSATGIIAAHPCRLKSVHATCRGANADEYIIKIYDSKDATLTGNTELIRMVFNGNMQAQNIEYDCHGVLAREGLYLEITAPAAPDPSSHCAVSVEFN